MSKVFQSSPAAAVFFDEIAKLQLQEQIRRVRVKLAEDPAISDTAEFVEWSRTIDKHLCG